MRSTLIVPKVAVFLAAIILVGVGLGWLAGRDKSHPSENLADKSSEASLSSADEANHQSTLPQRRDETRMGNKLGEPGRITPLLSKENRDWQNKIRVVLGSDTEVSEKRKQLLNLFPQLPEAGQVEAARHLINLVADEDYAPLGKILTNTNTPASVSELLLADLLNRANSLKVPLILEVARNPNPASASEARDLLVRVLLEDHGTNWERWEQKAREWLKQNPD